MRTPQPKISTAMNAAGLADHLDAGSYRAWRMVERHLGHKQAAASTADKYAVAVWQLYDHAGATPLCQITREQVSDYLLSLSQNRRRGTVDTYFRALRSVYNILAREELVGSSPVAGLPAPQMDEPVRPVVEPDDFRLLLKSCAGRDFESRRDTAILKILGSPGSPRGGELAAMTVDDFDSRHDVLLVRNGKWARGRLVPLSTDAAMAVERYLTVRAQHKAAGRPELFLGYRGAMTGSGISQMVARRTRRAGLPAARTHALRHTAAVACKRAKMDAGVAMALFGWKDEAMWRHYGAAASAAVAVEQGHDYANQLAAAWS